MSYYRVFSGERLYDKETDNLSRFGDNYLALQSIEHSKNIAAAGGKPVDPGTRN
jgi:hypothetical protein